MCGSCEKNLKEDPCEYADGQSALRKPSMAEARDLAKQILAEARIRYVRAL
jgi:hypothetical protein